MGEITSVGGKNNCVRRWKGWTGAGRANMSCSGIDESFGTRHEYPLTRRGHFIRWWWNWRLDPKDHPEPFEGCYSESSSHFSVYQISCKLTTNSVNLNCPSTPYFGVLRSYTCTGWWASRRGRFHSSNTIYMATLICSYSLIPLWYYSTFETLSFASYAIALYVSIFSFTSLLFYLSVPTLWIGYTKTRPSSSPPRCFICHASCKRQRIIIQPLDDCGRLGSEWYTGVKMVPFALNHLLIYTRIHLKST